MLVDTGFELLFDDIAYFFVDTGRNRDVSFDPRGVGNDGEFDRGEEVGSETASFVVGPHETGIVVSNEVVHE